MANDFTVFRAVFRRNPSLSELTEARKVYELVVRYMERHQCRYSTAFDAVMAKQVLTGKFWLKMRYIGFDLSPPARQQNGTVGSRVRDELRQFRKVRDDLRGMEKVPVKVSLEELGL